MKDLFRQFVIASPHLHWCQLNCELRKPDDKCSCGRNELLAVLEVEPWVKNLQYLAG